MTDIGKTSLAAAMMRMAGLACAAVTLLACAGAAGAAPAATNAAAYDTLARRAAAAERDGRLREAAAAYAAMLEHDDAFEPVVAPRLVSLHARMGETAPALAWAARVARRHPEPAAYLAGVYARLGLFPDAEAALRQALREGQDAARRLPLLWQLAETQEQAGEPGAARETLLLARQTAPDDTRRAATARRLDALAARQRGKPAASAPSPEEKREVRP